MKERDCTNCKHHTEDGCSSWDCEFEAKDLISRADAIAYIDRVTNSGLGRSKSLDYIRKYISALPSADAVKVAYFCDGRKCNEDCSECCRTFDIEHARDFKRIGGTYYQQESADAVQGEECDHCVYKWGMKGGDSE